jgi:hypothetical protein
VYLCNLLGITYAELQEQPDFYIEKAILWHKQKAIAEKANQQK